MFINDNFLAFVRYIQQYCTVIQISNCFCLLFCFYFGFITVGNQMSLDMYSTLQSKVLFRSLLLRNVSFTRKHFQNLKKHSYVSFNIVTCVLHTMKNDKKNTNAGYRNQKLTAVQCALEFLKSKFKIPFQRHNKVVRTL